MPDGSAQLLDADQVAGRIADSAVANPVRLVDGPTVIQRIVPFPTSSRTLEAEGVAIEGRGCVRVVVREKLA